MSWWLSCQSSHQTILDPKYAMCLEISRHYFASVATPIGFMASFGVDYLVLVAWLQTATSACPHPRTPLSYKRYSFHRHIWRNLHPQLNPPPGRWTSFYSTMFGCQSWSYNWCWWVYLLFPSTQLLKDIRRRLEWFSCPSHGYASDFTSIRTSPSSSFGLSPPFLQYEDFELYCMCSCNPQCDWAIHTDLTLWHYCAFRRLESFLCLCCTEVRFKSYTCVALLDWQSLFWCWLVLCSILLGFLNLTGL